MTTADPIAVACAACGGRFKVPASKAGKRGPCPKCKAPVRVPVPAAPAADDGEPDWNALADVEATAAPREADPVIQAAPASSAAVVMPDSASFAKQMASLTPEQRRALARRADDAARSGRRPKVIDGDDQLWGFPSFLMGLTLCVAGSLLGAGIWFGLLAATGRELRLLAVGVGALAGGGMYAGYQKHELTAGMIAAICAVGGIVLAKVLILTVGVGFLIDRETERLAAAADESAEEYFEATQIENVSIDVAREGAFDFELGRYRRAEGLDDELWYSALDWMRGGHEQKVRKVVAELDDEAARDRYRRGTLLYPMLDDRTEAAREAYRAEHDLPAAEDEENPYADLPEEPTEAQYAAAAERARELSEARELAWADWPAAERAAEDAAWAELDAMTGDEVAAAYDAQREAELAQTVKMNAEMAAAAGEWADEADDETLDAAADVLVYRVVGPSDLLFGFLALSTAFGIGTGMRAGD